MRTIAVVTTSRADYSHLLPLLRLIAADPELSLQLMVSGTHLSDAHGKTVSEIEKDGFAATERIPILTSSDSPEAITAAMGRAVAGFGAAFAKHRPDMLVVMGDRFELHAAVLAALPCKIPVAHISGGNVTEGAIDDALRHSMTKMSHLHFPSTQQSASRILQMGEDSWRVVLCGELSLDNLATLRPLSREELAAEYAFRLPESFLLVTYHPVTLEYEQTGWQITQLLQAIEISGAVAVFTRPNADTANRVIEDSIREFTARHPSSSYVDNFGIEAYFSTMRLATAMVGNSSSGICEAASLELPVINIGTRQRGRVHGRNVIDVGYEKAEILRAIRIAADPQFRASLRGMVNPYGTGGSAPTIVQHLKSAPSGDVLLRKRFRERSSHENVELLQKN